MLQIDRLREEVLDARLHGLHGERNVAVAADHDHDRRVLADACVDVEPGHVRQPQVEQHDVRPRRLEGRNAICAGVRAHDRVATVTLEKRRESVGHRTLVVDDQYRSHQRAAPCAITTRVSSSNENGFMTLARPLWSRRRYLFFAPWRSSCLMGTFYRPWVGTDPPRVSEELVAAMLAECNEACPGLGLALDDVRRVHVGLLPVNPDPAATNGRTNSGPASAPLMARARIVDQSAHGGPHGLVSVFGVKYTTARRVAEETVNVVFRTLGSSAPPCRTASVPRALDNSEPSGEARGPFMQGTDAWLGRLDDVYGSGAPAVLAAANALDPQAAEPLAPGSPVLRAEVVHAVSREMAVCLSDVVFRRTDLASEMAPAEPALRSAAELTAKMLGWSKARHDQEIAAVRDAFKL